MGGKSALYVSEAVIPTAVAAWKSEKMLEKPITDKSKKVNIF